MQYLVEKFRRKLQYVSSDFQRSLMEDINWEARLIGIKGARGAGKTTLLLQRIKTQHRDLRSVLYASLDDIWFADHRLVDLADTFVKQGGRYLFLDEVHKYPDWSRAIKNIYDDYPELQIVFTGSSLLEILNARADLSRRAIIYPLQGLSFREYLQFTQGLNSPRLSLEQILNEHEDLAAAIYRDLPPLAHFGTYLELGYYPYFKEIPGLYAQRLSEVINLTLEVELPLLRSVDISFVSKIKQLLLIIAESAPFKPNISAISTKIGINRQTLLAYLHHLSDAGLIRHLYKESHGISRLQKPDKIYLDNTNMAYALTAQRPEMGTLRETFFANQLGYQHDLQYPKQGDFFVNQRYYFEIGGPRKPPGQLTGLPPEQVYYAIDQIELGYQQTIPLWLFGFLY
jgi:predicted AAA+ superfamily ATPase